MMIKHSEITLQCDSCGALFYAGTSDPTDAVLLAEADGWTEEIEGETRSDYCALCGGRR